MFIGVLSCKTKNKDVEVTEAVLNINEMILLKHTVLSDGHPMAVWEKKVDNPKEFIFFIHGRTWSGVPDFDLKVDGENLSLMDGMIEKGYTAYAIDLRRTELKVKKNDNFMVAIFLIFDGYSYS